MLAASSERDTNVRLEIWTGCLCASPDHSRTYEQLEAERFKRMMFGTNVTVTAADSTLRPRSFLQKQLTANRLWQFDFYGRGVIYRQGTNGTYFVFSRSPRRLKMSDMKSGDLVLHYHGD